MSEKDPLTLKDLEAACGFMMKRITEALMEAETLRALLEQRGAFSADEYAAMHAHVRARWASQLESAVSRFDEDEHNATIRRLLESFEGPKQ